MRMHTRTVLARLAPLAAVGVLVAGCGGDATPVTPAPDTETENGAEGAATELTIKINYDEGSELAPEDAEPKEWTLTCSPAGGDHPAPEQACADLEKAGGPKAFDEVPEDQMCTHIYGGPEIAAVTGHVDDTEIDTEFNKSGGCEITRYENMGSVLEP
ncbi:SSI family serine proteinase inhibitor [Nocardiopsis rhodophaea]